MIRPGRLLISLLFLTLAGLAYPAEAMGQKDPNDPNNMQWFGTSAQQPRVVTIGSVLPDKEYLFEVQLSSVGGGGIESLRLKDYFETVADKKLYEKDPNAYRKALQEEPEKYKGHYRLIEPVRTDQGIRRAFESTRIRAEIDPNSVMPLLDYAGLGSEPWTVEEVSPNSVTFSYTGYRGTTKARSRKNPIFRIRKTYTVRPGDYSLHLAVTVENYTTDTVTIGLEQGGPMGVVREDYKEDSRRIGRGKMTEGKIEALFFDQGDIEDIDTGKKVPVGKTLATAPVLWLGHVNKFFGCIMHPEPRSDKRLDVTSYSGIFYYGALRSGENRHFFTGIEIEDIEVKATKRPSDPNLPTGSRTMTFDIFCGPKKRDVFTDKAFYSFLVSTTEPAYKPLYKKLNYMSTLDTSPCFCAWSWLTEIMMGLLKLLSLATLGNYGVAIILLVFVVRMILHPLTKKGQVSMMRMQKLGPRVQEIKEKYADDKAAQQKEMMKVYKEGGASPLLGCLPMFLQMPIWIALFGSIRASVELRHASFLPVWLTDLAAPDRLISWGSDVFVIGSSLNLLPLLLAVAMYLQTKLNPQMSNAAASPEQQQSQKMMRILMPGMMLAFFYKMPSGLNLYIMASTFAGVLEQKFIRRHIKEKEEKEAQSEVKVSAPGKGSRHNRPKKPKNPFFRKKK